MHMVVCMCVCVCVCVALCTTSSICQQHILQGAKFYIKAYTCVSTHICVEYTIYLYIYVYIYLYAKHICKY